jgi:hypothetical protein
MRGSASALISVFIAIILAANLTSCTEAPEPGAVATDDFAARANAVVQSEVVIEGLRVPLAALSNSVANLALPDERGREVMEATVTIVDLAPAPTKARQPLLDLGFERGHWPAVGTSATVEKENLSLWSEFLALVDFFHHFNFYNIRGEMTAEDSYRTDAGFKGLAQLRSGAIMSVEGKLRLEWKRRVERVSDAEETVWRIARFETRSLEFAEGPEPLFSDVSDLAFENASWRRVVASPRDEIITDIVLDIRFGALEMDEYLETVRTIQEEGGDGVMDTTQTVVVDVDRDGFDDFYVTGAGAESVFFRNNGDGTFSDITKSLGLDQKNVYSAAFGDLDNDGDPDAFLSMFNREGATRYLVNENGRFVDRTDRLDLTLPNMVIPITISDYNNDGLLDVYLSTYANAYLPAVFLANERTKRETGAYRDTFPWLDKETARDVLARNRENGHPVSHAYGPPNWLLVNRGKGRFERAADAGVEGRFNTLASAWSDLDLDGDMDLYVVAEGGPNELFRNNGDGTFTEATNAVTGEIGFGMGAGLGDYDNDGRTDIYTTNMYSKAGLRISEQMGSSEIVVQSARGNTLMRNTADGFVRVSSLDDSGIQVEAADFGWGGGFADFNNDGFLDLYVPAGQQSMPQEVATIGDS